MSIRSALAHRPIARLLPLAAAALLLAPVAAPSTAATAQAAAPTGRHLTVQTSLPRKHVSVATLPKMPAKASAQRTVPALRRDHGTVKRQASNPALPATTATLTIGLSGAGSVTSSPAGIDCPGTCAFDFPVGTPVTLTAAPGAGSYFAGWDNGCGSSLTCQWTAASSTAIGALFETAGPPVADLSATPGAQVASVAAGVADVTGCGSVPCVEPPDPWIAVGPDNVVQATNLSIRISDRTGKLLQDVSLPDFFVEPTGQINGGDPRVIWDGLHSRWIATEMSFDCSTGYLYLAVSQTADPSSSWMVYSWAQPGVVFDYPGLGVSTSQVVVAWNGFALASCAVGSYIGANFLAADADKLIAAPTSLPAATLESGLGAGDPSLFTWRPAVGLTYGTDLPLVVGMAKGSTLSLGFARLTGTLAANTMDLSPTTDLTQSSGGLPLGDPPVPLAFGTPSVAPFDARPTDAIAENGHVWVAASAGCVPAGDTAVRSCVRYLEIASSGTPSVLQDFSVGQSGQDVFGGGIGVSGAGSAFAVWSQSSATTRGQISTYAAYRTSGDPANSLRQPVLVAQGAGTYAGKRWGDYVGVARDPSDASKVWTADEVSTASGDWTTQISKLSQTETALFAGDTYMPVAPSRLLDTRVGNGLSGPFSSGVSRTFQVSGRGGVPANAVAVTGNLTVTQQTRAGYLALGPVATNSPTTSTLNFPLADARANGVTVPLGSGGKLSAVYITGRAGDRTAAIFDVTGYFVR